MQIRNVIFGIVISYWVAISSAQEITVNLNRRTPLDDMTVSIIALSPEAPEKLKLPKVDTADVFYLSIYCSKEMGEDHVVSALVKAVDKGQALYVDLNNDEDLTNDGEPLLFPFSQNELVFYLQDSKNPQRRVGRSLQRIPNFAIGDASKILDENGNLNKIYTKWKQRHQPSFEGTKNTFFFDRYVDVSRGVVELDGSEYAVGLYDYDQDGHFNRATGNDEHPKSFDRFLIDLGGDGKLTSQVSTEMFKLHDVFDVAGKRYKLTEIDPYGRSLTMVPTQETPTRYYLKALEDQREDSEGVLRGKLAKSFWDLTFTTTEGTEINMRSLRGRYVLLNFWGEWCGPCIAEIPALVATRKRWPKDKLHILGMLSTKNQDVALEMVTAKGMSWPQIITSEAMLDLFKINQHPTNILISPDGETYLNAGHVTSEFFNRNIE